MKYNFDEMIDRKHTNSIKWEHMDFMDARATNETLPFWVADMDFACAPAIVEALHARVATRIYGYTTFDDTYYDAAIGWYQRRFNWQLYKETIKYTPGIVPALGYLVDILSNDGDGIIIMPPVYYPFANTINYRNRVKVDNLLLNDNGYYTINYDELLTVCQNPKNKVLIFSNPHNPVGRVWHKDELEKVIEICERTNTYIIADEIHCDLIRNDHKHIPIETLTEHKNNIITTIAPSKTFNLAGGQMSLIIIHDEKIRERWVKYVEEMLAVSHPNPFGLTATIAAYQLCEDWVNELNIYLDNNFNILDTFLKEHLVKAKMIKAEGTYLAWIDLSAYGNHHDLQERFITQAKVFIEDGTVFGECGSGYFRMNIACPKELLLEGLTKLAKVLNA